MKAMQIYEELKQHSPEWIRSFMELAKLFEEAKPERKNMVINMLKEYKA